MPESSVLSVVQHPAALVETAAIGEGTRIGAFSHILPGARIGRACDIRSHTFLENDVVLGDRVTVSCGVQLWDATRVEDDVFIGPNATFARGPGPSLPTVIRKGAFVGANATIVPGIVIAEEAQVAPGAVVTQNVPRKAIVEGNPARIIGYTGAPEPAPPPAVTAPPVEGVFLRRLPLVSDLRGPLSFGEVGREVPFDIQRYFLVFDVATEHVRGEHAHRTLHQFLVCVHGRCSVAVDDGRHRQEFVLDSPRLGIYIPPMTWAVQSKYSPDAVLLVLASAPYDPADYIRDYAEFLALKFPGETHSR